MSTVVASVRGRYSVATAFFAVSAVVIATVAHIVVTTMSGFAVRAAMGVAAIIFAMDAVTTLVATAMAVALAAASSSLVGLEKLLVEKTRDKCKVTSRLPGQRLLGYCGTYVKPWPGLAKGPSIYTRVFIF